MAYETIPLTFKNAVAELSHPHLVEYKDVSTEIKRWDAFNEGLFNNPQPDFKTVCDYLIEVNFSFNNRWYLLTRLINYYYHFFPLDMAAYSQKLIEKKLVDGRSIYIFGINNESGQWIIPPNEIETTRIINSIAKTTQDAKEQFL